MRKLYDELLSKKEAGKHIYNTLNKQLFSTGYSPEKAYKAIDQYRTEINNAIEAPNVNCYGEDRAIAIAIGIVKNKQPSTFEVMRKLASEKRTEMNQDAYNQNCSDINEEDEYENSDLPF